MTHVALDSDWGHQYELMFSLIQIQMVPYRSIYRHVSIRRLVYTHTPPCPFLRDTRSNYTPVALSTPSTQVSVSKTPLPGLPGGRSGL